MVRVVVVTNWTGVPAMSQSLAAYDGQVGTLYLSGTKIGTLFLSFEDVGSETGTFRRRRWTENRLVWRVSFSSNGGMHPDEGLYVDDGEASELAESAFTYAGIRYVVDWLGPEEAERERDDVDPDRSWL